MIRSTKRHPSDCETVDCFVGVDEEVDRLEPSPLKGKHGSQTLKSAFERTLHSIVEGEEQPQVGWYIEVTQTHAEKVADWRRNSRTNGSRYTTEELVERTTCCSPPIQNLRNSNTGGSSNFAPTAERTLQCWLILLDG